MAADQLDKLFHAYDIRGDADGDLDCETAMAIARAFGNSVRPAGGRFVIGCDARVTSTALAESVSVGLRSGGHQVVHIGRCTTPMLCWYGAEAGFDGSVMITASHLPPQYNGFKLCGPDALPLSGSKGLPEVRSLTRIPFVFDGPCTPVVDHIDPLIDYTSVLGGFLKATGAMKLAVDAGNGVGGIDTHKLFEHFPHIWLQEIGFEPDGRFPHRSPNPLDPGALTRLATSVIEHGCAFGVAFDGDADRAIVVDETGKMVSPDLLGAALAVNLIEKHPGATILYDLRSSRAVVEAIESAGGRALRTRVGHSFIKAAMREHEAMFALELSGHYYYADLHYTDNGLRTLVELVRLVFKRDRPLSALLKPLESYALSGETNFHIIDRDAALAALEAHHADGKIEHLDGLSVDYPDWWFNARGSQTEPLLRLNVGAVNQALLDQRSKTLREQLAVFVEASKE